MSFTLPILLALLLCFAAGAWFGAPYLPTRRPQIKVALSLLELKPGETVLDLGSGSGNFLKVAAKEGVYGIGYEINPVLYLIAKINTYSCRDMVEIRFGNFWQAKLPPADGIYVFLITRYMPKLDLKLKQEIRQPLRLASYSFEIPGVRSLRQEGGVYLYEYGH